MAWLRLATQHSAVREALSRLKVSKVLDGFRGSPPADVDALVQAAVSFGDAFVASGPQLGEFEINPLIVGARGAGVTAVDALVKKRTGE